MFKLQVKKIGVALAGLGLVISSQAFAHDYRVLVSGRVQVDAAEFWGDNERNIDVANEASRPSFDRGAYLRRVDLFVKGHLPHNWLYRVGVNVANIAELHNDDRYSLNCAETTGTARQECIADRDTMAHLDRMNNTWIGYNGFENVFLAFGRIRMPQGSDHWMDDNWTTFLERASPAEAFAPKPGIGAYAEGLFLGGDLGWAVAVMTPDQGDLYPNHRHDNLQYGGRIHYAPFNDHGSVFHLGASAYRYNVFKNTEVFGRVVGFGGARVRETPPIVGSVFRGANTVDYTWTWGLEAGGVMGPFYGKAEYFNHHLDSRNGSNDIDVHGYYIEASYLVTGESRRYDRANGVFGGVIPDSTKGAWEVAARFARLDLSDRGNKETLVNVNTFPAQPGDLKNWTVGVNWYATKNVEFQLNYIHSHVNYARTVKAADQDGNRRLNTVAARGQIVFG